MKTHYVLGHCGVDLSANEVDVLVDLGLQRNQREERMKDIMKRGRDCWFDIVCLNDFVHIKTENGVAVSSQPSRQYLVISHQLIRENLYVMWEATLNTDMILILGKLHFKFPQCGINKGLLIWWIHSVTTSKCVEERNKPEGSHTPGANSLRTICYLKKNRWKSMEPFTPAAKKRQQFFLLLCRIFRRQKSQSWTTNQSQWFNVLHRGKRGTCWLSSFVKISWRIFYSFTGSSLHRRLEIASAFYSF